MFNNILVVCHGNICRSPVGMAMLQQRLPQKQVQSAGLGALVDHGVEPTAMELAAADGLDLSEHRARQLDQDLMQWADVILVMSEGQRRAIAERSPAMTGKTLLFGHWLAGDRDVPDPYRKSREAFEHVHRKLAEAADAWQQKF